MVYYIIATIVICYLLGSVNSALIISKLKKGDIRKCGSGNPGAMNMFRNYGFKFGLLTLVLDAIKGVLACLIGWFIVGGFSFNGTILGKYIGAISVIIGHIFPVFLKFKGGKGIASTIGICFMISPIVALISLVAGFPACSRRILFGINEFYAKLALHSDRFHYLLYDFMGSQNKSYAIVFGDRKQDRPVQET